MKSDDSSLTPEQYLTVQERARSLLDRGSAWGTFPTPVDQLVTTAGLKIAPIEAFDEGTMRRYLREAGEKAANLLRSALDKVLGIFDVHANTVHIDPTLYPDKQTFLKLHETGHSELPHQRGMYRWIQDCRQHLDPGIAALFEREANTFASLVLFQDGAFAARTVDEPFGIRVPMRAAKDFGASLYASFREYVRRHHKTCAVIILEPTETCPTRGPIAKIRRVEMSATFAQHFGGIGVGPELMLVDDLMLCVPFEPQRMSRPHTFAMVDRNGQRHEFVGEGFRTGYHTLVLIHCVATLGRFEQIGVSTRLVG